MLGSGAPRIVAARVAGGMALPSNFYTKVGNAEAVVRVRVLRARLAGEIGRTYAAQVLRSYKGCFLPESRDLPAGVRAVKRDLVSGSGIPAGGLRHGPVPAWRGRP